MVSMAPDRAQSSSYNQDTIMSTPLLRNCARVIAAALTLMIGGTMQAQSIPSDSAIRAVLKAQVDAGHSVGMVVGVLENGHRRYIAYGSAGAGRAPLDEHTIFEIGSLSKTFTSLLLADDVVRGKARLDEPVADLLPAGTVVPSMDGKVITLEELATHRSGLPRLPTGFAPANMSDPYVDYGVAQLDRFLSTYKLTRAPGDSAEYSNVGVGLLGYALVHQASAPSWGALVRDRIADPLGMHATFVDVPASEMARVSVGHGPHMDSVPPWHFDVLAGAGALRSTASDMLTYLSAELDTLHGPLARAVALGRKPRADFGGGYRIALGWLIDPSGTNPVWWHDGGTGGFASFAAFDPARNVAVVVLSNAQVPVNPLGMQLINPVVEHPTVSLSTAQLDRVVGEYQLAPNFVLSVTRDGDVVYLQATGQQKFRLWPEAANRFYIREVNAEVVFDLQRNGPATSVTLRQNGALQVGRRKT